MKSKKNLKIGITGRRGFIGEHVAAALKKRGAKLSFFDLPENNLLDPDPIALKNFAKNNDVIIHTAAVNRGSDTEVISGSIVATYNLLRFKSRAKFIFLSSIQAETDTLYGQSKKLTEIMLEDFSKKNNSPVSIFRLTNVFGEGGRPFYNSVVATFSYQTARGEKLTIHPQSIDKEINLVYVGDLARIIADEAYSNRPQKFYFKKIDSKNRITIGKLAKLIESFRGNMPRSKVKPLLKSKFEKDLYKTYLSYLNSKNGK